MKIKAIANTFLKKNTKSANELPKNQKLSVEKEKTYPVQKVIKEEQGHLLVNLGYNSGEWWIFKEHWDTKELINSNPNPIVIKKEVIDWNNPLDKISKYFNVKDVTKGDKNRIPTSQEHQSNILRLALELDKIQEDWAKVRLNMAIKYDPALENENENEILNELGGIRVTSWYRPPAINRKVGGSSKSQHITGNAVDIRPKVGNIYDFQNWLDLYWHGALGYGAVKGFVHLDMRNKKGWKTGGSKAVRWNY